MPWIWTLVPAGLLLNLSAVGLVLRKRWGFFVGLMALILSRIGSQSEPPRVAPTPSKAFQPSFAYFATAVSSLSMRTAVTLYSGVFV